MLHRIAQVSVGVGWLLLLMSTRITGAAGASGAHDLKQRVDALPSDLRANVARAAFCMYIHKWDDRARTSAAKIAKSNLKQEEQERVKQRKLDVQKAKELLTTMEVMSEQETEMYLQSIAETHTPVFMSTREGQEFATSLHASAVRSTRACMSDSGDDFDTRYSSPKNLAAQANPKERERYEETRRQSDGLACSYPFKPVDDHA